MTNANQKPKLIPTVADVERAIAMLREGKTQREVNVAFGYEVDAGGKCPQMSQLWYRAGRVRRGKAIFPKYTDEVVPKAPAFTLDDPPDEQPPVAVASLPIETPAPLIQPSPSSSADRESEQRATIADKLSLSMTEYSVFDFKKLPPEEQERRLDMLTPELLYFLRYDWEWWARPNQRIPEYTAAGEPWTYWVVQAGRGYGKTRVGAETVRRWIRMGFNYVNIAGATADDARAIMIDGPAGIMAVCPKDELPIHQGSKKQLLWPNGAVSLIMTADEPERFRGKQHEKLWADELAAWRYPEAWDQAQFGLRLGAAPQCVVTTTPRPTKLIRELLGYSSTVVTRGTTYENRDNLAEEFYAKIITKYEGTRLGRQELNAELLEDNPGALFFMANIEKNRVSQLPPEDMIERIVVAIDPPATSNEKSDECGLVASARDKRIPCHFYVFEDRSDILSPERWGARAVEMYHVNRADRIVGEVNNGGEMIERVIRTTPRNNDVPSGENVAYTAVHATRGKAIRAEPIAGLYEQNRVHHVGNLAKLEDQMCSFNPQTWSRERDGSPDRMDAGVWGLTDLSDGYQGQGLIEYLKSGMAERDLAAVALKQDIMQMTKGVGKVQGAGTLSKPAVADDTPRCSKCGSVVLNRISGSIVRCGACNYQFDQGSKFVPERMGFKELAKLGGRI